MRASHILISVEATLADLETLRQTGADLKARLEAGEPFQELREELGDLEAPDTLQVPLDQLQELPPGFAEPLSRGAPGEVLAPVEYEARGETRIGVVKVLEVLPAGAYSLDDQELRGRILQAIQQQKLVEEILEELKLKTYIQIRM